MSTCQDHSNRQRALLICPSFNRSTVATRNELDFLTVVPAELWLILFSLYFPDLVSVSAACRSFQALAAESLKRHRALRHRFHRLGHDYDSNPAYWYLHLLTLLREPLVVYYVEDLKVERTESRHEKREPWTVFPLLLEDESLIRATVEGEMWIPDADKGQFLDQLLAGDEDAMKLSLPSYYWVGLDFRHLMPIVARIAEAAASADGTTLPLSKLEHYEGHVFDGVYGVYLEQLAPLMALPSLRTMCTPCSGQAEPNWPASLPKSQVRKIDIPEGRMTRKAIESKGTRWDVDWDVLEIPFEGACEEEWMIRTKKDSRLLRNMIDLVVSRQLSTPTSASSDFDLGAERGCAGGSHSWKPKAALNHWLSSSVCIDVPRSLYVGTSFDTVPLTAQQFCRHCGKYDPLEIVRTRAAPSFATDSSSKRTVHRQRWFGTQGRAQSVGQDMSCAVSDFGDGHLCLPAHDALFGNLGSKAAFFRRVNRALALHGTFAISWCPKRT
ncbi:hypothetical protein B0H19DRAFT_1239370, partial [Mycena capillaripes]